MEQKILCGAVKALFAVALVGALAGCGGGGDSGGSLTPAPAATAAAVITSTSTESVKVGGSTSITVDAFDANGKRENFSFTSIQPNATVVQSGGTLTVSGLSVGRQIIDITSASGAKKSVTVDIYDPLTMDIGGGLMIKYVNTFDQRFINNGFAGIGFGRVGDHDYAAWHPRTGGNGWYALGSYIRHGWDDVNATRDYAMIVVKDTSATHDRLAAPVGFNLVWSNLRGGSPVFFTDASVWAPQCPAGYVALGLVVSDKSQVPPSSEDVRCVKSENTVPAKVGGWIIDDRGSRADLDLTVFNLDQPDNVLPEEGTGFVPAGTVVAARTPGSVQDRNQVDAGTAHMLRVNFPVVRSGDSRDYEPRLNGFAPFEPRVSRSVAGVRVPFPLVKDPDPAHTLDWKISNSPFYTIVREEVYSSGKALDNRQATLTGTLAYETEAGWSQQDYSKFTQEVGIEMTTGGDFKFASWEVKVSVKLGWEQSTATTYSTVERTTYTWPVPPGTFAQVIQVTSQMRVLAETGHDAGVLPMKSNIMKYLQYPR